MRPACVLTAALALALAACILPAQAQAPSVRRLLRGNPCAAVTLKLDFTANGGSGLYCLKGMRYGRFIDIPGESFTRASTKTALNSAGAVVSFGSGVPAITDLGFLVEGASTNLLLQSQFAGAWTSSQGTLTPNATTDPSGTATAASFIENSVSAQHSAAQAVAKAASAITYAYSVYFRRRAGGIRYLKLTVSSANGGIDAGFDTATGYTGRVMYGTAPYTLVSGSTAASINGWVRATLVFTSNTDTALTPLVQTMIGTNVAVSANFVYTGDGVSGLDVWGAQLEQASAASSYIPTANATVTRAADVASIGGLSLAAPLTFAAQGLPTWTTTGNSPRIAALVDGSSRTLDLLVDAAVSIPAVGGSGLTVTDIGSSMPSGTPAKMAAALSGVGAVRSAADGSGAAAVTGTATLGVATTLRLGDTATSNRPLSGYLKSIAIYPTVYTDAQLQALTQ